MANYSTGITTMCPHCGATNVPLKWGDGDAGMVTRVHSPGRAFSQNYDAGKCYGPRDLFMWLLAEGRLALAGPGQRYATIAEYNQTSLEVLELT